MMCLGGAGHAGRMAMRASYRDTRKGFRIGSGKRKHSASSAPVLSSKAARQMRMIKQLRGRNGSHPKHRLTGLRTRRRLSRPRLAQGSRAPLVVVMIGVLVLIVAAGALPINRPGVVLLGVSRIDVGSPAFYIVVVIAALLAAGAIANAIFRNTGRTHAREKHEARN